ncbi:MAG: polyprenol monophosphomannose synthase [Chloroflexi bacterium]|nr:MAG: polyprenol monophosphomannose synthase [Chloroflexota bacterium]RLC90898.1 MAG: polyprenol monophosphomannose synthase [Chloroflexota bacterium]HEY68895.1 polyprenol monophosphomannose synthase [Thermoflexia bacterium]
MELTVVVPTYNEAGNVRPMAEALLGLGIPALSVLFVDDESPDGTGRIAEGLAAQYQGRVHVLHRTGPRGLGRAYVDGFRWALAHGADFIVQMDCDFSHSPGYIPQFLEHMRDYDVVVGSRYVPGGRTDERWGWGRWLLSWWANGVYTRLILGCRVRDVTAGFKCWRAETLRGIDLSRIRSQGYVFQVEMAYVTERLGYRVLEIPIYFEDRRIGHSKMTVPVKIEAALRVWEVRWRHRHLRPSDRLTV